MMATWHQHNRRGAAPDVMISAAGPGRVPATGGSRAAAVAGRAHRHHGGTIAVAMTARADPTGASRPETAGMLLAAVHRIDAVRPGASRDAPIGAGPDGPIAVARGARIAAVAPGDP